MLEDYRRLPKGNMEQAPMWKLHPISNQIHKFETAIDRSRKKFMSFVTEKEIETKDENGDKFIEYCNILDSADFVKKQIIQDTEKAWPKDKPARALIKVVKPAKVTAPSPKPAREKPPAKPPARARTAPARAGQLSKIYARAEKLRAGKKSKINFKVFFNKFFPGCKLNGNTKFPECNIDPRFALAYYKLYITGNQNFTQFDKSFSL